MESEAPQVSFGQLLSSSSDEIGSFYVAQRYAHMPQSGGFEPSTLMNTDATHSISTSPSYASTTLPILQPLSGIPIQQSPSPEAGPLPDSIPTSALPSPSMAPFRKTSTGGSKPAGFSLAKSDARYVYTMNKIRESHMLRLDVSCVHLRCVLWALLRFKLLTGGFV